jgi:hypothetical protein
MPITEGHERMFTINQTFRSAEEDLFLALSASSKFSLTIFLLCKLGQLFFT